MCIHRRNNTMGQPDTDNGNVISLEIDLKKYSETRETKIVNV